MGYIRTRVPESPPQLLQITERGRAYVCSVLHAEVEAYAPANAGRAGSMGPEHAHDVYHIVLYTRGANRFRLAGREHECRRGTLALTGPGARHDFAACAGGQRVWSQEVTLVFACAEERLTLAFPRVLSLLSGMDLPEIDFPRQLDEQHTRYLEGQFTRLLEQLGAGAAGSRAFQAQRTLADLLAFLVEEVYCPDARAATEADAILRARRRIEQDYRGRLALTGLARDAGLSVGYFCRAFHRRFGVSPMAYQQRLRMAAARVLLRTTPLPIGAIAGRLGYADIYAFSRSFRRAVGRSPRAFRQGGG